MRRASVLAEAFTKVERSYAVLIDVDDNELFLAMLSTENDEYSIRIYRAEEKEQIYETIRYGILEECEKDALLWMNDRHRQFGEFHADREQLERILSHVFH